MNVSLSVVREKLTSRTELSSFFDCSIAFTLYLLSLLMPFMTVFGIGLVGLLSLLIERPDVGLI